MLLRFYITFLHKNYGQFFFKKKDNNIKTVKYFNFQDNDCYADESGDTQDESEGNYAKVCIKKN